MKRYILNTLLLILLIIFISFTRPCNSSLFSKPLWPCPYNSRLKHLYISESDGKYTSQSLFDIYSFTHISHGMIIFYITKLINKKLKLQDKYLFLIVVMIEILWEIIENSQFIINKYRNNSVISRNYKGDSIINSVGDIFSMIIGYIIAYTIPKISFLLLIINEMVLYYMIKDNLLTNILQVIK